MGASHDVAVVDAESENMTGGWLTDNEA